MQLKQKEVDGEWVELDTEAETETVYGTPSASASVSRSNSGFEDAHDDDGLLIHVPPGTDRNVSETPTSNKHVHVQPSELAIVYMHERDLLSVGPPQELVAGAVYTMTSCAPAARGTVMMDLSGGDDKSIIGFPAHGFENQQVCIYAYIRAHVYLLNGVRKL